MSLSRRHRVAVITVLALTAGVVGAIARLTDRPSPAQPVAAPLNPQPEPPG